MRAFYYGSLRLGIIQRAQDMDSFKVDAVHANLINNTWVFTTTRGFRRYELNNHLGNVLTTITDKQLGHNPGSGTYDYYNADVASAQYYYPFWNGDARKDF